MTLVGFDIARDQWGMNTSLIPHDFAIIGASDGATVNPHFHQQYATEKALGKLRAAYHFFRGNPAAEAAFFVANAREVPGDGQVWCDSETFFPDLPQRTLTWLEEVRRLTGVKPSGVYTSADFLLNRGLDWSPVYNAGYGLWEAAYVQGYQPVKAYNIPGGRAPVPLWGSPAMWQFTSTGMVPGWVDGIDLNVFYGDRAAWDAYIGGVTADANTITRIEQDWLDMATKEEVAAVVADTLSKWTTSPNGKKYAQIAGNLDRLDAILTKLDALAAAQAKNDGLTHSKLNNLPAGTINKEFTLPDKTVTNLAGLLDAIRTAVHAEPAPVGSPASVDAQAVADAVIVALRSHPFTPAP